MVNSGKYEKCFCYYERKNRTIEIRKIAPGESGALHIFAQEIIFVLAGTVDFAIENTVESRRLNIDEFIFVPTGARLKYHAHENSILLSVRITEAIPECYLFRVSKSPYDTEKPHSGIYPLNANKSLKNYIEGVILAVEENIVCERYLHSKAAELILLLHAHYPRNECVKFFSSILTPDMSFSEFIRLHNQEYETIGDLAAALCMTPRRFTVHFKRVFGTMPNRWLHEQRSRRIYFDLCQSHLSLQDISHKHGFADQSSFSRFCLSAFGQRPKNLRKELDRQGEK